jgi:exonuclease VII large subunit
LLARGYAIVSKGGKTLKDARMVDVGDAVDIQLAKGRLITDVRRVL